MTKKLPINSGSVHRSTLSIYWQSVTTVFSSFEQVFGILLDGYKNSSADISDNLNIWRHRYVAWCISKSYYLFNYFLLKSVWKNCLDRVYNSPAQTNKKITRRVNVSSTDGDDRKMQCDILTVYFDWVDLHTA